MFQSHPRFQSEAGKPRTRNPSPCPVVGVSGTMTMFDLPALPTSLPIETAGWHWLDVTLGVCLAFVVLNAARRGFVREAGTLIGLGVGLVLADQHALALADLAAQKLG